MKISDPFGRAAQKKQRSYENFRRQLQNAEIIDQDKLNGFKTRVDQTLYKVIGFIVLVSLLISLFFSTMTGIIITCSLLVIIWLLVNHYQTRAYIKRYRDELNAQ